MKKSIFECESCGDNFGVLNDVIDVNIEVRKAYESEPVDEGTVHPCITCIAEKGPKIRSEVETLIFDEEHNLKKIQIRSSVSRDYNDLGNWNGKTSNQINAEEAVGHYISQDGVDWIKSLYWP